MDGLCLFHCLISLYFYCFYIQVVVSAIFATVFFRLWVGPGLELEFLHLSSTGVCRIGASTCNPEHARRLPDNHHLESKRGDQQLNMSGRPGSVNRTAVLLASTVNDKIPVEILTIIFKHLYASSMILSEDSNTSPDVFYRKKDCGTDPASELRKPHVATFSFHLQIAASVCRLWREILKTMPEYKTRLLVCLDQRSLGLKRLKAQVSGTNNLPLDVLVTRKDFEAEDEEDEEQGDFERSRMRAVMDWLSPLLPRIRTFVCNTKFASSLPYISQDFHGPAEQLRVLKLQCKVDDEWNYRLPDEMAVMYQPAEKEFMFPNLATIVLHGCTFLDACAVAAWRRQLAGMSIDSLCIAKFTTPSRENDYGEVPYHAYSFNLYMLMSRIRDIGFIGHLTLQEILPEYDTGQVGEGGTEPEADNLTLRDLEGGVADELNFIIAGHKWCSYHIVNTDLYCDPLPMAHHLRIENAFDSPGASLKKVFEHFPGRRLDIVNCKELTDEHLQIIAQKCKNLRWLYLTNCPNITVEGVKKMISARRDIASPDDAASDGESDAEDGRECTSADDIKLNPDSKAYADSSPRRMSRLHIAQHPTKLTDDERVWFKNSGVKSFSWE
ncbi:unnamed protein product [Cyclocybe aegerita]|uniref:F-box domain-containing protein n=1 Tax=Cyclocybe aegerita TaxID=1973307 RepID=A0A8S0X3W0_CYCAE|nr:unnamed protein product [Cyclocybe aegerita]